MEAGRIARLPRRSLFRPAPYLLGSLVAAHALPCPQGPRPERATAYLVSGWSNTEGILTPESDGAPDVRRWLRDNLAEVRPCWWNSLHPAEGQNPGPFPRPFDDRRMVRDLVREIDALPPGRKVILIGHSFGASALLKAVRKTDRRIEFLGTLDPTGPFGLRAAATGIAVPPNVGTLWNRWQDASPLPFDFFQSGRIAVADGRSTAASQRRAEVGGIGAHDRLRYDPAIVNELIESLDGLNRWPSLGEGPGSVERTLPEGEMMTEAIRASDPDPADRLSFSLRAGDPEGHATVSLLAPPEKPAAAELRVAAADGPCRFEATVYVEDDGWPCGSCGDPEAVSRADGFSHPPQSTPGGKWAARRYLITIVNAPPTCTLEGPAAVGSGEEVRLRLDARDPSPADTAAGFLFNIDWGDGTKEEFLNRGESTGLVITHAFRGPGRYEARVTATDRDGGVSQAATHAVEVKEQR